jgi:hypothetical protein
MLLAVVSFPRTSIIYIYFTVPNPREKSQYSPLFLHCIRRFFHCNRPFFSVLGLFSQEIFPLRTLCPVGCCVQRMFSPKDSLCLRTFCLSGGFVLRAFCLQYVLSQVVLSQDVLSPRMLCLRTFCLCTKLYSW